MCKYSLKFDFGHQSTLIEVSYSEFFRVYDMLAKCYEITETKSETDNRIHTKFYYDGGYNYFFGDIIEYKE